MRLQLSEKWRNKVINFRVERSFRAEPTEFNRGQVSGLSIKIALAAVIESCSNSFFFVVV